MRLHRHLLFILGLATSAITLAAGCCARSPLPQPEVTASSFPATSRSASTSFTHSATGLTMRYPTEWVRRTSKEYALWITSENSASPGMTISLEVPELPPHLPGWIPIGLVQKGYLDDMRESHPEVKVATLSTESVDGATARFLRSDWGAGNETQTEFAWLLVHADHVLILRGISSAGQAENVRRQLEEMVRTIRWSK